MEEFRKLIYCHAFLRAGVAVAYRHRIFILRFAFAKRIEIHRDTERCADLVLRIIALADVTAVIPGDEKLLLEMIIDLRGRDPTSSGLLARSGNTALYRARGGA